MARSELGGRLLGALVAFAAGLLGATVAQRGAEPCACRGAAQTGPALLPEVEVVATRLSRDPR